MLELNLLPDWKEYYTDSEKVPKHIDKGDGIALYINHKKYLPDENLTISQLVHNLVNSRMKSKWIHRHKLLRSRMSFITTLLIAFFPKCPVCWAAYMSFFGFLGFTQFKYQPQLLPVLIGLFIINAATMYINRKLHGIYPLVFSILGSVLIILNRIYYNEKAILILGAILICTASLWNSLSKRISRSITYNIVRYFQQQP